MAHAVHDRFFMQWKPCIDACGVAAVELERCIADIQDIDTLSECRDRARDALDSVQIAAVWMGRDSEHAPTMARICAQICDDCASECERHVESHESCASCADACRHAAMECRRGADESYRERISASTI